MKEVSTSELKAQLNRMESKLNSIENKLDLILNEFMSNEQDYYEPTQSEINDIKEFVEKINSEWFEKYPYEKYEHSGNGKWEPITEGMRERALAASRVLKGNVSEEDVNFLKNTVANTDNATDLTEGQIKKLNALLYQLYKK